MEQPCNRPPSCTTPQQPTMYEKYMKYIKCTVGIRNLTIRKPDPFENRTFLKSGFRMVDLLA